MRAARAEFPMSMRFSSLRDRNKFYKKEFNIRGMREWTDVHPSIVYALIIGRHSRIFPREYSKISTYSIFVDDHEDAEDLRDYIIQYLPESVYYDRNLYRDRRECSMCRLNHTDCWRCEGFLGQQLAIDLDVENVFCPIHGDLDQRMERRDQLSFCEYDLFSLRDLVIDLADELRSEFKKMRFTYSGRGYHIHIFDEKAYSMPRKERKELADKIGRKYPIDEWVTEGESHLIRLPFSLNGLVSRIVLPLEIKELERFDPVMDGRCIPKFIKGC